MQTGEEQCTRVLDCSPRRVAGVVTWLAGDAAASISSAAVPVDRGPGMHP